MIGLPTETEEDVRGIAETARKIERISREIGGRAAKMTVSVASFVPKSHTPFQWEPQDTVDVLHDKQALLRSLLRSKTTRFDWHEAHQSLLEAVFARGDRRLASSVEAAFRAGARFDGWSDLFSYERWQQAFSETGIDPSFYANRRRDHEETLPWDHVSAGLDKSWLIEENRRALMGLVTPDCRSNACSACGVCQNLGIEHLLKGSAAR